jgi:hypothetical protein
MDRQFRADIPQRGTNRGRIHQINFHRVYFAGRAWLPLHSPAISRRREDLVSLSGESLHYV